MTNLVLGLFLISTAVGVALSSDPPAISLRQLPTGERIFIDSFGRQRIFHGVNVVVKGPPYIPKRDGYDYLTSFVAEDMKVLQDHGLNMIRLGAMWPGVEPVKGQYNISYLAALKDIVEEAGTYGIYSLLDMHQDCLSEHFCGEGVPLWATASSGSLAFPSPFGPAFNSSQYAKDNTSGYLLPTRQACSLYSWSEYQVTEAAATSYQALYTNVDGLRDSWGLFWNKVAGTFRGVNARLGYEIINEPFAGNVYSDPTLFIPGVADKEVLQGAYDAVAPLIIGGDPEALLFFPGVTWDDLGVGFDHVPGGQQNAPRSVLAYHYYEPPQFQNSEAFDVKVRLTDARRLQSGLMMTEFPTPGYGSSTFQMMANVADMNSQSWSMWELKDWCRETNETLNGPSQYAAFGACKTGYGGGLYNATTGKMIPQIAKIFSRTYAQAVAGNITYALFNDTTAVYSLQFNLDTTITAPTELYLNEKFYYPNGYSVSSIPSVFNISSPRVNYLSLLYAVKGVVNYGQNVTVTISPK